MGPHAQPYEFLLCLACSSLICMRSVLRSALIARRGHLGIKKKRRRKCQSTEHCRTTQNTVGIANRTEPPHPASQRTITILFSVSVSVWVSVWVAVSQSLSKIVLCPSCWKVWFLIMCYSPHTQPSTIVKRLFIKKSSLIVWKEMLLILHFTRWQPTVDI